MASILSHPIRGHSMRLPAILILLAFSCLGATSTALGQQDCEFNLIGTWKAVTTGYSDVVHYRFAPDGTLTVFVASGSAQPSEEKEIARATYELDDPNAPKSIAITTTNKNRVFLYGKSSIKILEHTETSMTCEMPGYGKVLWTRVDPNRYFIVLVARRGEFYDKSGSAFPILVKVAGRESQVNAVGTYSNQGKNAFGVVPPAAYKDFMREPRNDSEVMLRLEINAPQYERSLKILRTWERRVRNDELLYFENALNNVLLVKAVTETLNQCTEEFELYKLYIEHDWIAEQYQPAFIPFAFFKELRRLNESRHVRDDKFPLATLPGGTPQGN